MSHCPNCNSDSIRRSRTRNRWERWRKEITGMRPYRCRECNWRGWRPIGVGDTLDAKAQARRDAADPPNLRGTALVRSDPHVRFDVKQLDAFHKKADKDDE